MSLATALRAPCSRQHSPYLADQNKKPFKSATFLTTQTDFSNAGDLTLLIGNEQLQAIEAIMAEKGYLDGSRMANVFNMLRPRDLIWPYIVNNYMLGKEANAVRSALLEPGFDAHAGCQS